MASTSCTEGRTLSPKPLISIVDDDESLRRALVGLVRSLGYRAQGYGSAEAFLADPEALASACVVTDIQMPGLDGIALLRRLLEGGRTTPVIMVTARDEPALHERARASGAFCLLRKPFAGDALIECLERALAAGSD